MPTLDKRGSGFVHLNTPASISYTPGQALTLTELTRKRGRVECVTLPTSMSIWRRAFREYVSSEGFQPMAADAEDERANEGVILPPLAKKSATTNTNSFFSVVPPTASMSGSFTRSGEGSPVSCSSAALLDQSRLKKEPGHQGHAASACQTASPASLSTSHETASTADLPGGIHIVSHHKVIGKSEFTYFDYDGILSSGVIPEVVITPEEEARKEADKKYYISPLQMTNDELNAFEELQSLWKSKARSHSVQGAMHRAVEEGSEFSTTTTSNNYEFNVKKNSHGDIKNYGRVAGSYYQSTSPSSVRASWDNTEVEEGPTDAIATEEGLADALQMVDDLLRLT